MIEVKPNLKDSDWMPWGKYGPKKYDPRRMKDLPVEYMNWYWNASGKRRALSGTCPVAIYIRRKLDALRREHPEMEWE